MNILHMKYAVEVARLGSLSKAAETLLTAQPNISRSIKELEASLGITIFSRSSRGAVLTPEGEEFINFAKEILKHINDVEQHYKENLQNKQKFSITVLKAKYISEAFAMFSKNITDDPAEFMYMESDFGRTLNNVLNKDSNLGIIRFSKKQEKYFEEMLKVKNLEFSQITEFPYMLLMNKFHPLAQKDEVYLKDLLPYIEVGHTDVFAPSYASHTSDTAEIDTVKRRILIFESTNRLELLSENNAAFSWTAPVTEKTLLRYGLVCKECADCNEIYKDVLIWRSDYKLSKLDKEFMSYLNLK